MDGFSRRTTIRRTASASRQRTFSGKIGVLRRKYNFGDRVSELAISQDPFFRFVSLVSNKSTDDPSFKFTERRQSFHKRYVYVAKTGSDFAQTSDTTALPNVQGNNAYFKVYTDWSSSGNKQNIFGQTSTVYEGSDSQPEFLIPGQMLKINTNTAVSTAATDGYQIIQITDVNLGTANYAKVTGKVVKVSGASDSNAYCVQDVIPGASTAATTQSNEALEHARCYVVGTGHEVGSGYPETWDDQPFTTGYGQTQIWKTTMAMNNTDRATVLKYEGNEWARIWKEKLIEHKWDIEQSLLFGTQASTGSVNTTQGAFEFISTYGNKFSLYVATKYQDSFLDDMSAMLDPRYNNASSTIFFCSTAVYNWLHKLSGYFANNLRPMRPPQSCAKKMMFFKSSLFIKVSTHIICFA